MSLPLDQKERVIRPVRGLRTIDFEELWRYRELFVFLSWRDILVRYKQTYLGVLWAVLQQLLPTIVFTVIFGMMAGFPSNGVPYAVMTLAGMLPWQFFSNALTESSNSLVGSGRIISKVYFPRLIIPVSAVLSGIVDALVGLLILVGLILYYHVPLRVELLLLPLFLGVAFLASLSAGIWLSALNVKYRDVKYIVPFITRFGLYLSPVAFMSDRILHRFGEGIYLLYCLNPMVGVIDGFRWCIFGQTFQPYWAGFGLSLLMIVVLLVSGLIYFRTTEKSFADVV